MTDYTLGVTIDVPYEDAVDRVRALLADAGFGVLTEIDLAATFRAKLGVEVPPRVILGACRPQLAHRALEADPRIATMLPCNVVIAQDADMRTRVEVLDPAVMTSFSDGPELAAVAAEARERLSAMLAAVDCASEGEPDAARA